jgi:hypothetical protein
LVGETHVAQPSVEERAVHGVFDMPKHIRAR